MIHKLKTHRKYFEATANGEKPFTVRKNDRGFKVGDVLLLQEIKESVVSAFVIRGFKDKEKVNETLCYHYTGREITCEVTYILDDPAYCKEGYVIMSIRVFKEV